MTILTLRTRDLINERGPFQIGEAEVQSRSAIRVCCVGGITNEITIYSAFTVCFMAAEKIRSCSIFFLFSELHSLEHF
jgi:hypothetical protein